jgi:hypothetical protein
LVLFLFFKRWGGGRRQRLTPVILATQEAEIRSIAVQRQPGKIVHETLSRKNQSQKWLVSQGVSPEFKPPYFKKEKKGKQVCVWGLAMLPRLAPNT